MKKFLSLIMAALMLAGLFIFPVNATAATSDIKAGAVSITSGHLNVRRQATTASAVTAKLPKGYLITLISKSGAWWYVRIDKSSYGYCHASYINELQGTSAKVNTAWGNLNVRNGAGTEFAVKGKLSKGENVVILQSEGTWSKILYHGSKTGYVSSAYLKKTEEGYKRISLNVPYFRQTDPRWANTEIGTSGKTIARIGCATTSISMIESYRKGYNIYPDTMSKKLSYSSSGNLYWPTDYKVTLSQDGYLQRIYDSLSQGKPVLFGAKNRYGTQHWIVITGFSGDKLTPSCFTINDPGSSTRKTLADFSSSYPYFYKFFTY